MFPKVLSAPLVVPYYVDPALRGMYPPNASRLQLDRGAALSP